MGTTSRVLSVLVAAGFLWACESKDEEPPKEDPKVAEPTADPEPEPMPEPEVEEEGFITVTTSLRKIASDDRRIDDPEGKSSKKISNWVATLYRGEEVLILGAEGDWLQVRASDDSEGWVKKKGVVRTADVSAATNTEELKVFRRPDLMSVRGDRTIDAGTLLYVTKTKDQFSEVDYSGYASAWVLSEKLLSDSKEISAAKLLNKIRNMREKKDEGVGTLEELARGQFADTEIIKLLDAMDEAAAKDAETEKEDEASDSDDNPAAEDSN